MAGLAGKKIKDSYKSLIRVDDDTNGLDGSLANITDGGGNTAPFQMSQTAVEFAGGTSLTLGASTAFNTRQVNAPSGTLGVVTMLDDISRMSFFAGVPPSCILLT